MSTPALVYLDQSYVGRMVLPRYQEIGQRVLDMTTHGEIVCPMSLVHLMETTKAPPDIRGPVLAFLERVSAGHYLRNEISIFREELVAHTRGMDPEQHVRSRILATTMLDAMNPSTDIKWRAFMSLVRIADRLLSDRGFDLSLPRILNRVANSREINDGINRIFSRASAELNQSPSLPVPDRACLATALGVDPETLTINNSGMPVGFPSIAVRMAIQASIRDNKETGFEGNDLPDLGFLSTTLPYFDVVTLDRAMGARVREARRLTPFRAVVVSNIDELGPALDALGQRAECLVQD